MARKGILLINLGTPKSPQVKDVRSFLLEFLSDPYVIDLPAVARYLILYLFILPFRPRNSAEAYRSIWTKEGSPLLVYSNKIRDQLALQLGNDYLVTLGMRYGRPDIASALKALVKDKCSSITVLPLFPQYSSATTESALQKVRDILAQHRCEIPIVWIDSFYNEPFYTGASASLINQALKQNPQIEDVVLSFHSLPTRQVAKTELSGKVCNQNKPCPRISADNKMCYRAQCYQTARSISSSLHLKQSNYHVCFQSKLGRNSWIGPMLEDVLRGLREQGVSHLAVACPSFVADCVETLEEIGIRAKDFWRGLGGDSFVLVPCLNSDALWIQGMQQWLDKINSTSESADSER